MFITALLAAGAVGFACVFGGGGTLSFAAQPTTDKPAVPAKPKTLQPTPDKAKPAHAAKAPPAGGEADMNAPGEMHKKIDFMVGKWDVAMKFIMAPGAPANESKGIEESKWDLDNRFVTSAYRSEMAPGMMFTGKAIMGFNTATKKYESVWADSTANGLMFMTGTMDDATHTLNMTGEGDDMMTGKRKTFRTTYTMLNKDSFNFKMFDTDAAGKEFANIDATYTRAK